MIEELECLTGKTYIIESDEFDELIKKYYGIDFVFVAELEAKDDTYYLYKNITKRFKYKWERRDYSDFLTSTPNRYTGVDLFLRDMVMRDILPSGNYIISVS